MNPQTSTKLKLILACLLWGSVSLFVRNIPLDTPVMISLRAIFATFFLLIVFYFSNGKSFRFGRYDKKQVFFVALAGVCMGLTWLTLFTAYRYTTVAIATLSHYTGPIILGCVAPLLFKETFRPVKLIAILISAVGLFLVIYSPSGGEAVTYHHTEGILFALTSSVTYAGVIIFNKLSPTVPGLQRTLIQMGTASILFAPFFFMNTGSVFSMGAMPWALLLFLAIIQTGFAYFLYFNALRTADAQDIILISYLDPITAVIFGAVFFLEPFGPRQFIGAILIFGSTFVVEWLDRKLRRKVPAEDTEA